MMSSFVYCSEDRAVERAEEERRWCKDIVMLLRRCNRHEIPTTSDDVALIASFLEYFRYVYLGATNGWIQLHAPVWLSKANRTASVPFHPTPPNTDTGCSRS